MHFAASTKRKESKESRLRCGGSSKTCHNRGLRTRRQAVEALRGFGGCGVDGVRGFGGGWVDRVIGWVLKEASKKFGGSSKTV